MPEPSSIAVVVRRGRGRPPKAPHTPLARFLVEQMRSAGITRPQLAARLDVSPTTVGRILSGDTTAARSVTESKVCEALGLKGMKRREFLRLARQAGAFTLAVVAATPRPLRFRGIDLGMLDDRVEEMNRLLEHGEACLVMDHARTWYESLARSGLPEGDPTVAEAKVRVGLVLAAAQEAALPWYQRAPIAIQTYERIVDEAIYPLPLLRVAHSYARILERLAPLQREVHDDERSIESFDAGILYADEDPELRVMLLRNRAHVWAVRGDELRWRRDLDAARAAAERVAPERREMLLGLLRYSEGEGHKRLAYDQRAAPGEAQKQSCALRALEAFDAARTIEERQRPAHGLLVRVAEAQCLVWLDPREALRRAETLRGPATRIMPGALAKVERLALHAQRRLETRRGEGMPRLSLDHPPGVRSVGAPRG